MTFMKVKSVIRLHALNGSASWIIYLNNSVQRLRYYSGLANEILFKVDYTRKCEKIQLPLLHYPTAARTLNGNSNLFAIGCWDLMTG